MLLRRSLNPILNGVRCSLFRDSQRTAHSSHDDDRDLDTPKGTHLNFLNDPEEAHPHLYINKYSANGFTLSSGIELDGSVVFFPRSFINWKVNDVSEINEESLSLFKVIHPKLDILIIGTGSDKKTISKNVIKYLRENRINFEILPTEKAIPTFNFLSAEQRWVAAALIPPSHIVDSLSKDIKDHFVAAEEKAFLEGTVEEELTRIDENVNKEKIKTVKSFDQIAAETLPLPTTGTNMFGYKIIGSPLEADNPKPVPKQSDTSSNLTKESDKLPPPQASKRPSSGIRYIRRSDYELNKAVKEDIKDVKETFVVRSPLEMSRKSLFDGMNRSDRGSNTDKEKNNLNETCDETGTKKG